MQSQSPISSVVVCVVSADQFFRLTLFGRENEHKLGEQQVPHHASDRRRKFWRNLSRYRSIWREGLYFFWLRFAVLCSKFYNMFHLPPGCRQIRAPRLPLSAAAPRVQGVPRGGLVPRILQGISCCYYLFVEMVVESNWEPNACIAVLGTLLWHSGQLQRDGHGSAWAIARRPF